MKVDASIWFEFPGAFPDMKTFDSIRAVREEFQRWVNTYDRYGGSPPVGMVYAHNDHDYPIYTLEVGPRGGVQMRST